MKIIESTRTFTPEEVYHLTKDPQIDKLSKHAGELLEITGIIVYEDQDADGEVRTVVSFELTEGAAIASNSATVMRSVHDILDIYKATGTDVPWPLSIVVIQDKSSKSGRTYYNIALAK